MTESNTQETRESTANADIIRWAKQEFPPHVAAEGWFDPASPFATVLLRAEYTLHGTPQTGDIAKIESTITTTECSAIKAWEARELELQTELDATTDGSVADVRKALRPRYEALRKDSERPLEARCMEALAITSIAMRKVFSEGDTPFSLWPTQRLAILRGVRSWLEPEGKGAAIHLSTGEGKSSAVLPGALPALLLIKPHIDVMTQRPLTRDTVARRFQNLGWVLGITSDAYAPEVVSPTVQVGGAMIRIAEVRSIPSHALSQGVTFLLETDLGHALQGHLASGNTAPLIENSHMRGAVIDEVEETNLNEAMIPMVVSGPNQDAATLIARQWRVRSDVSGLLSADMHREDKRAVVEQLHQLNALLSLDGEGAGQLLANVVQSGEKPGKDAYDNLKRATLLLRFVFRQIPDLARQTKFDRWQDRYFTSSGGITPAGWYELRRRVWQAATGQPFDNQKETPQEWESFLETVFSLPIVGAVNATVSQIRPGSSYFQSKPDTLGLMSATTGFPQTKREYAPLTTLAMYARESLTDTDLRFPAELHETIDQLSHPELMALAYSKFLGLSGTAGNDIVAWWLEMRDKMRVIAVPSNFEQGRAWDERQYIPVAKEEDKLPAIADCIRTLKRDHGGTSPPIIVDAPSIGVGRSLTEYLGKQFSDTLTVRMLSAENAADAETLLGNAGDPDTTTVIVLMAGREIDIRLPEESIALGGLMVLGWEPRPYRWDERQLVGRAGRKGQPGGYTGFVAPKDGVFDQLDDGKKHWVNEVLTRQPSLGTAIARAFGGGWDDVTKKMIEEAQQAQEIRLIGDNLTQLSYYDALIALRRNLHAIVWQHQRGQMLAFWPHMLTLFSARFGEYISGWHDKDRGVAASPAGRILAFRTYTREVYNGALAKASAVGVPKEEMVNWFVATHNK